MAITGRSVAAVVLLLIGAVIAVLAVGVHYGFMRVYGDVAATAFEAFIWGLTAGPSGLALGIVAAVALVGLMLSTRPWMRFAAGAIPVLMLIGMFAVTPSALERKLDVQFSSGPQCVTEGSDEPMASADREAQRAFDSVSHIGNFSGGGVSGVGGCERKFVLSSQTDVLQHYRSVLVPAGWTVVADDGRRLRAQRDGMAFEVIPCPRGGVIWAGSNKPANGIHLGCEQH